MSDVGDFSDNQADKQREEESKNKAETTKDLENQLSSVADISQNSRQGDRGNENTARHNDNYRGSGLTYEQALQKQLQGMDMNNVARTPAQIEQDSAKADAQSKREDAQESDKQNRKRRDSEGRASTYARAEFMGLHGGKTEQEIRNEEVNARKRH